MIIVDTSALFAIQYEEPEAQAFARLLRADGRPMIGAPTLFEYYLVVAGKFGPQAYIEARLMVKHFDAAIINWDEDMAEIAAEAWIRFGKGRHPAALNFGDCMSYAIAKSMSGPLLFKGDDFSLTDVERAV